MAKKKSPERAAWHCPECGRAFRLPKTGKRPDRCPQCAAGRQDGPAEEEPIHFAEAPSQPAASASRPRRMHVEDDEPRVRPRREIPADVEAYLAGKDREKVLEHLANISRTMTFFRRLVWGMLFFLILNIVVTGFGLFYAVNQLGSLGGLLQQPVDQNANGPGRVGPAGGGGQAGMPQLEEFKEYADTLRDLVRDVQNQ